MSDAVDPIYSQTRPNEPIDLGQAAVQFDHEGTTYRETANVVMRFLPETRLEFVCPLEGKPPLFGRGLAGNVKLTLEDRGVALDVLCTNIDWKRNTFVFSPNKSGAVVTPPSGAISTATFHLFNFPEFMGPEDYVLTTGEPPLQGRRRCGRVVLDADGWNITLAATGRTDNLVKALKAQGGHILTHLGRIARQDGSTFSSERLEELLSCLHYFLSFALGRWAGIALPVGFDTGGKRVFEEWGMRITADGPWKGSSSWFDEHHGELLSQVFPGFASLWAKKLWRRPLAHALYWYLGACDRRVGIGVDTGLILAQTASEVLAWTYCVLDREIVPREKFGPRGFSAARKLRLLTSSLGVPLEIPPDLSALRQKRGNKWADGMDAITDIRNSLVHPDAQTELPDHLCFEGWNLSLWYIDLVLLRLCGHDGNYANRLALRRMKGQVEPVPWARKQPPSDT